VRTCVCVCLYEREREGERERVKVREGERVSACDTFRKVQNIRYFRHRVYCALCKRESPSDRRTRFTP